MGRKKKVESINLEFNPVFEPLFSDHIDNPRYYQVYGGRGSGKTFVAIAAMVQLTYSSHNHKILFLRQTMASSEDSTIAGVRTMIKDVYLASEDFRESKGVITNIKTGSTINFKGIRSSGNQSAKLKSLEGYTTVVFEEAEEIEGFDEFSKVDEGIRLKGKPLKIILVYNPTSAIKSWIHEEWFEDGEPKESRQEDTIYMHSTYLDNLENLAPSTVKRYEDLKYSNPTYYEQTILAKWTLGVADPVYAGWGKVDRFDEDDDLVDVWYGLDFSYGGDDFTSLVKISYFEKTYYVELLFSVRTMRIRDTLRDMKKLLPYNAKIFADSAMPLLITEIRDGGFSNIRKAQKGLVPPLIKRVENKDIVIVGSSKRLYHAYLTFGRKNGKLPHEPDELAALRYGITSKSPINKSKKKSTRKRKSRKEQRFIN